MTTAFVLGNGISRKGVPLHDLSRLGKIYGCNLLYQDFAPDVLVATDRPIATRIQETGYSAKKTFYTRRPIDGSGAHKIPTDYFGFSSGPVATALAALANHRKIYMIGFDMGPDKNKTFNNMYAGQEFYKASGTPPTYTGNWIKQICRIAQDFPQTQFVRVMGATTAAVAEFENIHNLKSLPLNTFLDRINNQKDL